MADISKIGMNRIEGLNDGFNNCLNKQQITNCITEIPQDIKLELNNGTLTLKAGSKIYVPNGFEADGVTKKFDEVVIKEDKIFTASSTTSYESLFGWADDKNSIWFNADSLVFSGSTTPSTTTSEAVWYDTGNNIIKKMSNGAWVETRFSLPLGRFTRESGVPTKINQVFNGLGYIGSTIFVLTDVKGLIPNGRNANETLKNKEFTTDKVITRTFNQGFSGSYYLYFNGTTFSVSSSDVYNSKLNWNTYGVAVGNMTLTSDVISNFQTKQPFKAVDYNDIFRMIMPDYTKGVNKGNSFISDGYYLMYVTQTFSSTGSVAVTITINGVAKTYDSGGNWGSWVCPFYLKPGDTVSLSTNGSGISETCYPLGMN